MTWLDSDRIGMPLQGFSAEVSPHNFAQATSETLMASERKDSDSDQPDDPLGLRQTVEQAQQLLQLPVSTPRPQRVDRTSETERSREHHPDPPVIASTPPHSPLQPRRSCRGISVPPRSPQDL